MSIKENIIRSIEAVKTTRKGLKINQIKYSELSGLSLSTVKKIELFKCNNLDLIIKYINGFEKKNNNSK